MRKKIAILLVLSVVIAVSAAVILFADVDGDGLTGLTELRLGTGIFNSDSDGDGLRDGPEVNTYGTNPKAADTDGDNLDDGKEINGWSVTVNDLPRHVASNPLFKDSDEDNLSDWVEYSVYYTDPRSADSDFDRLSDWEEVKIYITNPVNIKIAVISDTGGEGDLAFNDMVFKGGEELEEIHGVEVVELISKTEADYLPNLRAAAEDPPTILIVGVGSTLSETLAQVAQEFPDKNFIGIDTYARSLTPEPLPNLVDVMYEEHKGSALVGALGGILAAYYDRPYIGAVFGIEDTSLWEYEIGYKWGCDWAMKWYENHYPDNYAAEPSSSIVNTPRNGRVLYTYTGTFNDIEQGYWTAKAIYVENAVAVYNVAGALGLGINQAVEKIAVAEVLDSGPPFWIGVDADQDWINPGFVIASMMKRVDYGIIYGTELVRRGLFREEGIVGYPDERRAMTLGIGTEVAGIPMEGISISTLTDLDEFIQMGVEAEERTGESVLPMFPDEIRTAARALREAQPNWIWTAVEELENKIRAGEVEVPLAISESEIIHWRSILG